MKVTALDHVNIECRNVDLTAEFYSKILGMTSGDRPDFARPGHWMYINGKPIVHLITPAPGNAMLTGSHDAAISHFSLRIDDYDATKEHLDLHKVDYEETAVPGTSMRQFFFDDPNGVVVELLHVPS